MACIPMRNVGAIVAGLATLDPAHQDSDKNLETSKTEGGELRSTRWPPLPTIAQAIDQMQGGCDGYAYTPPCATSTRLHPQMPFHSFVVRFACADS